MWACKMFDVAISIVSSTILVFVIYTRIYMWCGMCQRIGLHANAMSSTSRSVLVKDTAKDTIFRHKQKHIPNPSPRQLKALEVCLVSELKNHPGNLGWSIDIRRK